MKIKIILFVLLLSSLSLPNLFATEKQIRLYAMYTPSHKVLFDNWFYPSLQPQDNYELILETHEDQYCPSARYMKKGWTTTTQKKVIMIIHAIEKCIQDSHDFFIYADVDIQFLSPSKDAIKKAIADQDIVFQKDSPKGTLCTGFFVCRANEKTLNLWKHVLHYMRTKGESDQKSLNFVLRKTNEHCTVRWELLPETFFGGGTLNGRYWKKKQRFSVPPGAIMHHANWTKGVNDKIAMLSFVKKAMIKMKKKQ